MNMLSSYTVVQRSERQCGKIAMTFSIAEIFPTWESALSRARTLDKPRSSSQKKEAIRRSFFLLPAYLEGEKLLILDHIDTFKEPHQVFTNTTTAPEFAIEVTNRPLS